MTQLRSLKVGHLANLEDLLPLALSHTWTRESIRRHMDAEAAKHPGNLWWRVEQFLGGPSYPRWEAMGRTLVCSALTCFTTLMVTCVLGLIYITAPLDHVGRDIMQMLIGATSICAGVSFLIAGAILAIGHVRVLAPAKWEEHAWQPGMLSDTSIVPPLVAQDMAKALLKLTPKVTFVVAKLTQKGHTGLLDPVLFAVKKVPGHVPELLPMCAWNPDGTIIMPH